MGKQYEAQKMTVGGDRGTTRDTNGRFAAKYQSDNLRQSEDGTAGQIAREHGIGRASVTRAEKFAKGVDAAEAISPGAKCAEMSRKVQHKKR